MAKIPGTNIDESVLRGMNENKREEILERIATDIAAGDVAGANDALFSLAYNTGPKAGQGQGNPNVGKLQSGQWRLNEGETWAEQAVKSESGKSDIYVQRDEQGNVKEDTKGRQVVIKGEDYGKPMTLDDIARAGPQAFLYGTNIPTAGLSIPQVTQLNRQLKAEMDKGDKNAAMNVLFHAVHTLSKAAGIDQDVDRAGYKEFMSRVYDGQFRFNSPVDGATTYAEVVLADPTTGTSDRYVQRDLDGNPTVELVGKDYTGPTSSNIPTKVVTGNGLIDYAGPPGGSGVGTGVGGLLATTPYTQPAPQDWSALAPFTWGAGETAVASGLPPQQAIFGPQGRALQPWATGQQVPAGLTNYQIPGGTPANVTYSNPNLGLFNPNKGATTSGDTTATAATSGNFMGQPYSNMAQYHNLLSLNNKAMQLIRGGHNQGRGIGQLMADPNWVNTQYADLGGTDPIVGGGSFGNYIAPPGETAPLYYGDATANPHLVNTYDTSRAGTMNIFQGGQDYDAPVNPLVLDTYGILGE